MTGEPQKIQKCGVNEINIQKTACLSEAFLNSLAPPLSRFPKWLLPPLHWSPPPLTSSRTRITPFHLITLSLSSGSWPGSSGNLSSGYHYSYPLFKKIFFMDRILTTQQLKEPRSMFFPQNCAHKAEFVGSISKWFKPVQFLLDQDYDQPSQVSQSRRGGWRGGDVQVIISPALCIEHSTPFIGIFLPLFQNSFPLNLRRKITKRHHIFSQCCS